MQNVKLKINVNSDFFFFLNCRMLTQYSKKKKKQNPGKKLTAKCKLRILEEKK